MASKRDLLHAHQFLAGRSVSALVTTEPDPEQPPFRRPGGAAIGSIVLGILALVAVGVYGLVNPGGNTTWRDTPAVIVAEETGTRYVYLGGVLHPVENYVSGLLALGKHAETVSVSIESLRGVPRGRRIGIDDAPDALPAPGKLLTGGWSLCSRPTTNENGQSVDETLLLVGKGAHGGRPVGGAALLVDVRASGDRYLVANGYRHRIRHADSVAVGLALRSVPVTRSGMPLIDILPAGEPLAPIRVAGTGKPSTAVPSRSDLRAGQLLVVATSAGREYYLAETDRLRPISELQYEIQRADPRTREAYQGGEPTGIALDPASAAGARLAPAQRAGGPGAPPAVRPRFTGGTTICATHAPGNAAPTLHVDPRLPDVATMATPGVSDHGIPLADRVHVEPGHGALVEVMPSAGAPAGTLVLITDQARAFPLASGDVAGILGYGDVEPVRLPVGIIGRMPLGSGLDPAAVVRAAR